MQLRKANNDQMLAFGWANVAITANGKQIEDWQNDIIEPEELENAAYNFVELYREGGEMHERGGTAVLIESIVFTEEKIIHWKDAESYRKKVKEIKDSQEYLKYLRAKCKKKLDKLIKQGYDINSISKYATKTNINGKYDEVYTEYRTKIKLEERI